jgi:hypothetical protein
LLVKSYIKMLSKDPQTRKEYRLDFREIVGNPSLIGDSHEGRSEEEERGPNSL